MFVLGLRDMGGANAILPVAKTAKLNSTKSILFADTAGAAHLYLKQDYPLVTSDFSLDNLFNWFDPEVAITATDGPGSIVPVEFISKAHHHGIKTVLVQDFWGNHGSKEWETYPDLVCVQDIFGQQQMAESWPAYPIEKIKITGSPAFDQLAQIDCVQAQEDICKKFHLVEDWPIIHFVGGGQGMAEALGNTIYALNRKGVPVYFFLSHHPNVWKEKDSSEQYKKIFESYKDMPKLLNRGRVIENNTDTNLINAGADIVVSMSSTMLVQACYWHKPGVSVWVPSAREDFLRATGGLLDKFPPSTLGACLSGTNIDEVAACFEQIFRGDISKMAEAQKSHFIADGLSASRILSAIYSLVL